jgi:anti-sigma B factor antagonist
MRPADLRCELRSGVLCARIAGEIDMSNATELRVAITDATPNSAMGIVIDLSELEYLDSAGIHLIYRLRESLRARGQGLALVIPRTSVIHDPLRLAGIGRGSEVVETVDEGLRALNPGETTDSYLSG